MVQLNFDATRFEPIGPGMVVWDEAWYPVVIVKSETKGTNAKNQDGTPEGHMLTLHIKAIDGPRNGQEHQLNLNLWNKSDQAIQIANRTLSAICYCVGMLNAVQSEQLHNKPFLIFCKKETRTISDPRTGQTREVDGNNFTDYKSIDGKTATEVLKLIQSGQRQAAGAPGPQAAPGPAAAAQGWQPNAAPQTPAGPPAGQGQGWAPGQTPSPATIAPNQWTPPAGPGGPTQAPAGAPGPQAAPGPAAGGYAMEQPGQWAPPQQPATSPQVWQGGPPQGQAPGQPNSAAPWGQR